MVPYTLRGSESVTFTLVYSLRAASLADDRWSLGQVSEGIVSDSCN